MVLSMFFTNSLVLVALIPFTALQQVEGGLFNSKPKRSPIEYLDRKFNEIIEPVGLMFSNLKDCAMEFVKKSDRNKLMVCAASAFEYTGLNDDASRRSFEKKFQSTFTATCKGLGKLVRQGRMGNGTFAVSTVDDATSSEEKSDRLKEIVKYDLACKIISEELTPAEVYETFSGKVNNLV